MAGLEPTTSATALRQHTRASRGTTDHTVF